LTCVNLSTLYGLKTEVLSRLTYGNSL